MWKILVFITIAFVIAGLMWGVYRFNLDERIIQLVRKKWKVILIIVGLFLVGLWVLFCELQAPLSNKKHNIKILVTDSTLHGVNGSIAHEKKDKYGYVCANGHYEIEKRTLFGWKKIREEYGHDEFSTYISGSGGIRHGERKFAIHWNSALSEGRYRLRYSLSKYEKNGDTMIAKPVGSFYIPFQIRKK